MTTALDPHNNHSGAGLVKRWLVCHQWTAAWGTLLIAVYFFLRALGVG